MSYKKLNEAISQQEFVSDDDNSEDFLLPHSRNHDQIQHWSRLGQCMRIVFEIIVCAIIFGSGAIIGPRLLDRDVLCIRHVSQDSSLLDEVHVSYTTQRFNGSLFEENVFRQTASPEVDAAWDSLGINYNIVILAKEHAQQAGFRPDQVRLRQEYGGGYPAKIEVLQQLHCLDLVRQSLYYNYDYYKRRGKGTFVHSDRVVKAHVSHCLDIVRQQLMCTAEIGFLGQIWSDPTNPTPSVDFNTNHKCRNFDTIRQWAKDHQFANTHQPEDGFIEPPRPDEFIYPDRL